MTPAELAAARAEILEMNRGRVIPHPVCGDCNMVFHPFERGTLHKYLCLSCDLTRTDALVQAAIEVHGRRAVLRALRALGRRPDRQ
jgi:hypothetical protein